MSESFGIVVEVKGAPQAVQAVDGVERALADVTAIAQKFGNEAVRAMREASAGAKQQKAAQDSLARAYREIVGPAADYNRKLQEAIALERQGAISAKQRADYVRGLQREMRQFAAQQQGGIIGGIKGAASSQLAGVLGPAAIAGTAVTIGREVIDLSDNYTLLTNRLKTVTESESELASVRKRLFEISNATRSEVAGTVEVYARMASSGKALGKSQSEILQFTESLNKAVKLSGATTTEATAGMIQLAQGLGAGALRGDELRSVLEQLPAVADVIAKSLGVTRGQLRVLGEQGKITADQVFEAFAKARDEIDGRYSKSTATVADSWTVVKNKALEVVGSLSEQINLSGELGKAIGGIGDAIAVMGKELARSIETWKEIDKYAGGVGGKLLEHGNLFTNIRTLTDRQALVEAARLQLVTAQTDALRKQTAEYEKQGVAMLDQLANEEKIRQFRQDWLTKGGMAGSANILTASVAPFVSQYEEYRKKQEEEKYKRILGGGGTESAAKSLEKLRETAGREFFASIVDGFDEMGAAAGRFADQMPDVSGEVAIARDAMRQMAEVEAATLAERLDRQRQVFDEVYGAGIRYQQMIEAARAELDRGALSIDQFNTYAEKLRIDTFGGSTLLEQMRAEAEAASEAIGQLSDALSGQLGEALNESVGWLKAWVNDTKVDIGDAVRSMLIDLGVLMAKLAAFQILKQSIGVDGGVGGFLAGALGFAGDRAGGGTYVAPNGGGGTDSVPLFARVSPGERVTFTPPGQQPANAAPPSPVMIQPVIVHDQAAAVRAALSAPEGVQVVVSAVSSNPAAFRAALGLR